MKKQFGYIKIDSSNVKNKELINKWKLYIGKAVGSGDIATDWINPIIGEPYSLCTETYLAVGPFKDEQEARNAYSYTQTKFFHFMFGLKKITQNTTAKSYQFVPLQDFSKSWIDEELYAKYGLTQEEIDFIESMVKPVE